MVTSDVLHPADVQRIATAIAQKTRQMMDKNPSSYKITPFLRGNSLSILIKAPLIDRTRKARILSVTQFPTFKGEQKFISACKDCHILIYDNSNHYSIPSSTKFDHCLRHTATCLISGPRIHMSLQTCASAQFYDQPSTQQLVPATDNLPFIFTQHNTTVFSFPHKAQIDFHCDQVDHLGADKSILLNSRGSFKNTMNCKFELADGHLTYIPSARLPLHNSLAPIQPRFPIKHQPRITPEYKDSFRPHLVSPKLRKIVIPPPSTGPSPLLIALIVIISLGTTSAIIYCLYNNRSRFQRFRRSPNVNVVNYNPSYDRPLPITTILKYVIVATLTLFKFPT